MFEDLRQKLMTVYKTAHDVSYPSLAVNYPDRTVVDPEGRSDPFVVLGVVLSKNKQMELGSRRVKVNGEMLITYHYRPGSGLSGSTNFSDFLFNSFGLRTLSGITFKEVSPYNSAGRDGWEGTLNVIPFTIEYYNT